MFKAFKTVGWLIKLIAAGCILSFLSIWTTGYIVTSYVDAIMKQYQLPLEVPPVAMSGVWGKLWGADPPLGAQKQPEASADDGALEAMAPIDEESLAGDFDDAAGNGGIDSPVVDGSAGDEPAASMSEIDGSETAMTVDDLVSVKEQISYEDKDLLFELLIGKLPLEDWQKISQFVEEGLTEQELTVVQQIIAQHLNAEEYEEMMDILKKY